MIRAGDVRIPKKGKTVIVAFGVWAKKKRNDIEIHITCDKRNLKHLTISNNPKSGRRYHRVLFRDLKKLLSTNKRWPFKDR